MNLDLLDINVVNSVLLLNKKNLMICEDIVQR